jgi:RNA polymerase sigma factor (sigma-70 family)
VPIFLQNRALLDQFRRGERQALEQVYRAYFDQVYRLARHGFVTSTGARARPLEREDDRMDFVQDVFVKAFAERSRQAYDGLRPYRPFLLQTARNLRIDQLRKSGRELGEGEALGAGHVDIDALIDGGDEVQAPDAVEGDAQWQLLVRTTSDILSSFDAETRTFAELRFVKELSQADVAAELGVTRRKVRTLESRLFAGVKRLLRKSGLHPEKK